MPPGVQYVSPLPGSNFNPPGTTIILRYGDVLGPSDFAGHFTVAGTSSGAHAGRVVFSDDQKTLIFKPDRLFAAGETVKVAVDSWTAPGSGKTYAQVNFSFSVTPQNPPPTLSTAGQLTPQDSQPVPIGQPTTHYATVPSDFPVITVTVPANGTAPGLIFTSNFQTSSGPGPSGYYLMILDNNGEPVYYQKLPANSNAVDFKELPDGTLSYGDRARNAWVIMDNHYREIKTLQPGNGYQVLDEHDLQLLPNGHYLILADEARTMDLSKAVHSGSSQAQVTGQVLQELDTNLNVVFQWRLLDYLPVTDSDQNLTAGQIDYSHANSVDPDSDGNLLLSIRHLDEVVKIDHQTGAIIWQLGGKENDFTFSTAPGIGGPAQFYHQHDVRRLPNGHLTVFDNHNDHQPQVSRALEYALDENAKTATLVWSYGPTPTAYALAMGNVQRLANGNTVSSWGTNLLPNITEVKADGTPALVLDFNGNNVSYRAFRFDWHGYPTWAPTLVANATNGGLTLAFSWNGATGVASYRVFGGNSSPLTNVIADQPRSGFETNLAVPDGQNAYCFYQVVPVDSNGNTMQPSAVVTNPTAAAGACPATPQPSGTGAAQLAATPAVQPTGTAAP